MIGVVANPSDHVVVREFFELFKTSWEFCRDDRDYDVVLSPSAASVQHLGLKLTILYGSHAEYASVTQLPSATRIQSGHSLRFPVYGQLATFAPADSVLLVDEATNAPSAYICPGKQGSALARIGYDLFSEIATLLTTGQPAAHSAIPTLDLHIALLRELIVSQGIPLIEIPPIPEGYRFIACLTHDIDHPLIRRHKFDHTMFGFLYRAAFGSLVDFLCRRVSLEVLGANWLAVAKLPFVYLGLAEDFWGELQRYDSFDQGSPSTFFVIPFQGRPGMKDGGLAPMFRACHYGAADIATKLRALAATGHEIALHGIDAWRSTPKCCEELEEIRRVTGVQNLGVRMHWLYFEKYSQSVMESAGVDYDSTIGYSDAIGYRSGTVQVYKPLETVKLLELPLHIMDTALFSTGRMRLSERDASTLVTDIVDNAVRFGGVVTINWHDRSIAPERNWGDFYAALIHRLNEQGAWLASARQTVEWFRVRRSAEFQPTRDSFVESVTLPDLSGRAMPGLTVRHYNCSDHYGSESEVGTTPAS